MNGSLTQIHCKCGKLGDKGDVMRLTDLFAEAGCASSVEAGCFFVLKLCA